MANAQQQFDELDLLGKWTVTSRTGWLNNSISRAGGFYFGDIEYNDFEGEDTILCASAGMIYDMKVENGYWDAHYTNAENLRDFFISNGNKLHIQIVSVDGGNPTLHFVIDELTETTMKLHTFDNSCQLILVKESSSIAVANADNNDEPVETFNLRGERVENPTSGIVIERRGSSTTKRLY